MGSPTFRIEGVCALILNLWRMPVGQENVSMRNLRAFGVLLSERLEDEVYGRPLGRGS